MLTLQELKEITGIPEHGAKTPTAKNLRETGKEAAGKRLRNDAWIVAYRNGYALYHAGGHSTVFPVNVCGAYLYASNGAVTHLPEQLFAEEPWYLRLALEGEDRLERNQRAKEQERTVSYSAISEDWEAVGDAGENPLEYLVDRENRKEILQCLTARQRMAVNLCFFQQKTQKEAAKELGISGPAVSIILSQAARRLRKKYPSVNQAAKVTAV